MQNSPRLAKQGQSRLPMQPDGSRALRRAGMAKMSFVQQAYVRALSCSTRGEHPSLFKRNRQFGLFQKQHLSKERKSCTLRGIKLEHYVSICKTIFLQLQVVITIYFFLKN